MVSSSNYITVIKAGRSDHKYIHDILTADAEENHRLAPGAIEGFQDSLALYDYLNSDSFWILIALYKSTAVGYLSAARIPKADSRRAFLFIDELWVLNAYRRRGIATELLAELSRIGKEIGAYGIRLISEIDNDVARAFYLHSGFSFEEYAFCQKKL